jgi:hypothetical protein
VKKIDRKQESVIINPHIEALFDEFEEQGRPLDAVTLIALFRDAVKPKTRDYHLAHAGDDSKKDDEDELLCEAAYTLNKQAVKVARGRVGESGLVMPRTVSVAESIRGYVHCAKCLREQPASGQSPRDFARLNFGFTDEGIQVWCVRHDCNVIHIDFEGQQHPARSEPYEMPDVLKRH